MEACSSGRGQAGVLLAAAVLVIGLLMPAGNRAQAQQAGTITGTVTNDATGATLPGVNVVIEGSTQGAATGPNGEYTITGVEPGMYTLIASFVGYGDETEEGVQVSAGETTTVDITMQQEATGLDEVVVVGYGEQQRRDLTGAVSTVSPQNVEQLAVSSLEQGLQGQVAGVQVRQASGQPGSAPNIRIRGGTSINAGNDPLYVIDGLPIYSSSPSTGTVEGPSINPLSMINPSNIASIQVLKDASATAIYGARGANGVVLIETKEGAAGNARINFTGSLGMQSVRKQIDVLNAMQFAEVTNEAYTNSGEEPFFSEEELADIRQNGGTDWQDEIFRSAPVQNYQLSASGGSEDVRYAVSGGYLSQEGIVIGSDFERVSLRANLNSSLSSNFRIGSNLTVGRTNASVARTPASGGGGGGVVYGALFFNPTQQVRNDEGSYTLLNNTGILLGNPVAQARELTNETTSTRFLGTVFGEYDLGDHLTARVSVGSDLSYSEENYYAPSTIYQGSSENGVAEQGRISETTWLNENTLNYDRDFGDVHSLDLLAGFTVQGSRTETLSASSEQFATDALLANNLAAGSVVNVPGSNVVEWGLVSYLGRANYSYKDRYLFTATARVDGSSRFGEGNKYGFFPSGAIAWRLIEEDFVQALGVFSNLKLRASYGVAGNQEIGTYQSLALLGENRTVLGNAVQTGFAPARVANPDLRWETTRQLDIGLDVGLFDGRVSANMDVYNKETTDLLLSVPTPWTSGFSTSLQNLGSLRNRGIEVAVETQNVLEPFRWTTSFNLAVNRNEVLDLGPRDRFLAGANNGHLKVSNNVLVAEGEPIGTFYGLERMGIFQSEEEVAGSAQPDAEPGQIRYRDLNGDGTINADDRTIIGNARPDFTGGFSSNLSYGGFDLSANFNFSVGNDIFNVNKVELALPTGGQNNSTLVLDRWSPSNPDGTVPRPSRERALQFSDWYLEDGSYLRLQNLTLGYNVPSSLLSTLQLERARLYVSARNLLTLTGYSGYDPELSQYANSNLSLGYDYGTYPTARTYSVGVSLNF